MDLDADWIAGISRSGVAEESVCLRKSTVVANFWRMYVAVCVSRRNAFPFGQHTWPAEFHALADQRAVFDESHSEESEITGYE